MSKNEGSFLILTNSLYDLQRFDFTERHWDWVARALPYNDIVKTLAIKTICFILCVIRRCLFLESILLILFPAIEPY